MEMKYDMGKVWKRNVHIFLLIQLVKANQV